jgi:SPW repeat
MKALSWIVALAGLWEIVAPFILGFGTVATGVWNNVIVGIILIILGVWAAVARNVTTAKTLDWIAAVVGLWLIVSPFILGTSVITAALWNDIVVGIIALVCGAWAALAAPRVTV